MTCKNCLCQKVCDLTERTMLDGMKLYQCQTVEHTCQYFKDERNYCDGKKCEADHRKQRGRTAPNRADPRLGYQPKGDPNLPPPPPPTTGSNAVKPNR